MAALSALKIFVGKMPFNQTRLSATHRTVLSAVKCRIKVTISKPIELRTTDCLVMGYVDIIEVAFGKMRVVGWAAVPNLKIETELQSVSVDVNIHRVDLNDRAAAFGFEAIVNGTDFLKVKLDGDTITHVTVARTRHKMAAWLRAFSLLATVCFRNGSDIKKWFLTGDSIAGSKLEQILAPRASPQILPIALSNIFDRFEIGKEDCVEPVDIILPVFNAYDDLCMCLDRLEKFTATNHRIVIIDDASTDHRVKPLILEFMARRLNVEFIQNRSNLGFVSSVNLGLSISLGHVVLLNSDALVAARWLDRLLVPIRSCPDIASVTPMTNNGEIASVPVICRAGALPEGLLDQINSVAMLLDPLKAVADVPTGVGFCMAISRHWLERVPNFDVAFGRGYGEEVDWCQRVAAQGARHVLTGAVFVEHRGGMSFGSEKANRIAVNNRVISKRYPTYDADVEAFIRSDQAVGQRIVLGLAVADQHVDALPIYLGHRLGGGAEHWLAEEISRHLDRGRSVAVLRDGDVADSVLFELHGVNGVTSGQVPLDDMPKYFAGLTRLRLVYSNLVAARAPLELLARAVSSLKPIDEFEIVFHDFLPLCPSYNLINTDGTFCGLPEDASCQRCYAALATTSGQRPATIGDWRNSWRLFMYRATDIVVFSEDSRKQVERVWPDLADQIEVRPHRPKHLPNLIVGHPRSRFTVGVLGGIGYSKGAKVLRDLAACMTDDMDIVVIGKLDPSYTHPRITVHGAYDRVEIAALAGNYRVDCWFIPSIWPETFCYAAYEALATGLPVFVYDLGAQAAAASAAKNGYLLPIGCEGKNLLNHLRENRFRPKF